MNHRDKGWPECTCFDCRSSEFRTRALVQIGKLQGGGVAALMSLPTLIQTLATDAQTLGLQQSDVRDMLIRQLQALPLNGGGKPPSGPSGMLQ